MLKKRSEFLKTYKSRFVQSPHFKIYYLKNNKLVHRLGITVPKEVGNAVIRNRYRRWTKEIFKEFRQKDGENHDIHVFIRKSPKPLEWNEFNSEIKERLNEAFKRAF